MTAPAGHCRSPERLWLSAFSHVPTAGMLHGPLSRTPRRAGGTGPGTAPLVARWGSGSRETLAGGEGAVPGRRGKLGPPAGLARDTKCRRGQRRLRGIHPLRRRWQCSAGDEKGGMGLPPPPSAAAAAVRRGRAAPGTRTAAAPGGAKRPPGVREAAPRHPREAPRLGQRAGERRHPRTCARAGAAPSAARRASGHGAGPAPAPPRGSGESPQLKVPSDPTPPLPAAPVPGRTRRRWNSRYELAPHRRLPADLPSHCQPRHRYRGLPPRPPLPAPPRDRPPRAPPLPPRPARGTRRRSRRPGSRAGLRRREALSEPAVLRAGPGRAGSLRGEHGVCR